MTNLEIVKELYRCFKEKDDDGFKEICDQNLEWRQNPGFPNGKTIYGADAVIEHVFKGNRSVWENFKFNIEEFLDAGDSIMVIGQYEGRHHKTQKEMKTQAAHVYSIKNSKIVRFRMFADTKTMWDAMTD